MQVVFKQIKEQTNLNFVYNADQLKTMQKVTLNVKEVTVDAALTKLFEGSAFEYKFEMQSIVIKKKTEQAESKKSMVVRSGDGQKWRSAARCGRVVEGNDGGNGHGREREF